MPELPEAENIRRALQERLPGRRITRVEVFTPAMRTPLTPLLNADLEGAEFLAVRRRGRYLAAEITGDRAFLMHFGMSGVVRVEPASVPRRKHEHLFLHLDDGSVFRFECPRRFSLFELHALPPGKKFPAVLDKLGVEPLEKEFTASCMFKHAAGKKACVKVFLMDNAVVTGIGNIYATETLFASGIDPRRRAGEVELPEWRTIVRTAKKILARAIEAGGTTVSDFLNVDGSRGEFADELQVYGKAGLPCPRCGTVIESVTLGGRSSAFCPKCQK